MAELIRPGAMIVERPPLVLTFDAAAKELQVSRTTLESLVNLGLIRCIQLKKNGDRRITYAELARYVHDLEHQGFAVPQPESG